MLLALEGQLAGPGSKLIIGLLIIAEAPRVALVTLSPSEQAV